MNYPSHIKENHIVQTHKEHSEEVAALCGEWGKPFGLEKTCYLTGLLHDMGKGTALFREYIEYSHDHPNDKSKKGKIDHSTHGAKYIYERYGSCGGCKQLAAEWMAMAILSHHGGLQDFITLDGNSDFLRRVLDKELSAFAESQTVFFQQILDEQGIDALFTAAVEEVRRFDENLSAAIVDDREYLFCSGMAVKLIFSILIDADRSNTAQFMTGIAESEWQTADLWESFAGKLEAKLATFTPANEIEKARQRISDECLRFAENPPGIYELSVPTGSGKTLASMRYALAHAKKFNKERILICIPYTSIIDQNAKEIGAIFQNEQAVLEHHSNVVEELDEIGNADYDRASEFRRAMTERWDVPVIFTTMVQLLNTLFAGGTRASRRLHQLHNSVIIFDEIQTLPIKCTYLFNSAMNFLTQVCKVTIVLCTATQPTLEKVQYPIRKSYPSKIVPDSDSFFEIFRRTQIENITIPGGYTPEEVAALIWQDAVRRGNVLCIVNTTASAKNIFKALKALQAEQETDIAVIHLSTKMCPAHRKAALQTMLERLGRKPLICVSTQLIEAGVDISFTTVYRAVAALSSVAQAAGRCNRHGKDPDFGLVKLFTIKGETLSRLPDMAKGAQITTTMLASGNIPMSEMLSPQIMERFFTQYYNEQSKKEMSYVTKNNQNTLYDLLAGNSAGYSAWQSRKGGVKTLNYFAFREAGKEFAVIDSQTVSVLVPYGQGRELYLDFNSNVYKQENIYKKLKQAQQYMVNLFAYEVQALLAQHAVHELAIGGVLALQEKYYDADIGVVLENQGNEFAFV